MSNLRKVQALKERARECREEAESLRDEARSLENEADELDTQARKLPAEDDSEWRNAVADLMTSPGLAEWERLRLEENIADGKLKPSTVLSKYLSLGKPAPAVVFDEINAAIGGLGK